MRATFAAILSSFLFLCVPALFAVIVIGSRRRWRALEGIISRIRVVSGNPRWFTDLRIVPPTWSSKNPYLYDRYNIIEVARSPEFCSDHELKTLLGRESSGMLLATGGFFLLPIVIVIAGLLR